jgi:hypothetical protein
MAREPRRSGRPRDRDVAESDLIRHAEHGDQHSTDPIWRDAAGFATEEDPELDDDVYGVADDEDPET